MWQLEAAGSVLEGEDLIHDVGTGDATNSLVSSESSLPDG